MFSEQHIFDIMKGYCKKCILQGKRAYANTRSLCAVCFNKKHRGKTVLCEHIIRHGDAKRFCGYAFRRNGNAEHECNKMSTCANNTHVQRQVTSLLRNTYAKETYGLTATEVASYEALPRHTCDICRKTNVFTHSNGKLHMCASCLNIDCADKNRICAKCGTHSYSCLYKKGRLVASGFANVHKFHKNTMRYKHMACLSPRKQSLYQDRKINAHFSVGFAYKRKYIPQPRKTSDVRMLDVLPTEIVCLIVDKIEMRTTLRALKCVSKGLGEVALRREKKLANVLVISEEHNLALMAGACHNCMFEAKISFAVATTEDGTTPLCKKCWDLKHPQSDLGICARPVTPLYGSFLKCTMVCTKPRGHNGACLYRKYRIDPQSPGVCAKTAQRCKICDRPARLYKDQCADCLGISNTLSENAEPHDFLGRTCYVCKSGGLVGLVEKGHSFAVSKDKFAHVLCVGAEACVKQTSAQFLCFTRYHRVY